MMTSMSIETDLHRLELIETDLMIGMETNKRRQTTGYHVNFWLEAIAKC